MKVSKSLIAGIIALLIVLGCGILEVTYANTAYRELGQKCDALLEKIDDQTLKVAEMNDFEDDWKHLREMSELFLPHLDIYEINLRVVEVVALLAKEDWSTAYAQMAIVKELLDYIPTRMIPDLNHIL